MMSFIDTVSISVCWGLLLGFGLIFFNFFVPEGGLNSREQKQTQQEGFLRPSMSLIYLPTRKSLITQKSVMETFP